MVASTNKNHPPVKNGQTRGPLLENIIADIARHYKTSPALIKDKEKYGIHALCRQLYCYIAYKITNATLKEIGTIIGKDHSTVIHHRDKAAYWIAKGDHAFIDEWFDYLEGTKLWGQYEKIR